ncbi:translation initiation factor 1 [Nematocida sp. AWRm77]|nr:translation initiation factor 1 [Nematocida sp. AWRm77]
MEWRGEEEEVFSDDEAKFEENEIHIRKQIRRGRKCLTTVENIPTTCNMEKILADLRKELSCSGTIVVDGSNSKQIIQMQGDHGRKIQNKLQECFPSYKIVFHGS